MLTSPHSFLSSVFFFLRFLLFASTAWADVKFTSPAAGTTLAAGTAVGVSWQDSGVAPHLADLNSYQLFLCAGGSAESEMVWTSPIPSPCLLQLIIACRVQIQLATISSQGRFVNGNSAQGVISAGLGSSDTKNA